MVSYILYHYNGYFIQRGERAVKELEYTTQSVPKGKRFCTICGEVKRLHYFEGDSTHCSACCEKMLHTHVHVWAIPVALVLMVAAVLSVMLAVQVVPYSVELFKAEIAVRDKRLADACTIYATAVSTASERNAALLSGGRKDADGTYPQPSHTLFEAGTRTWTRYLETYAALYSEYEAATLAQGSLSKSQIETVPFIAGLNEAQEAYNQTLFFAQELDAEYPFTTPEEMPYDKLIEELTAFAEENDSRYFRGYVELYKGKATQYYKQDDPEASKVYYEKMLEYLPDEFMTAYTSEADAAIQAGNYDAAVEAYEKILERNRNYTDAYPAIAKAAFLAGDTEKYNATLDRFEETDSTRLMLEMWAALRADDLDQAAAVRQRANEKVKPQVEKIFNSMLADQEIDQSDKAVLLGFAEYEMFDAAYSLVKDDTDEAFRIAYDEAFNYLYYYSYITSDSSAFSQSVRNMVTLCANLAKDQEAIEMITQIGQCDQTTQQVIDGELSVRDVFVEGKAEII